MGTDLMHKQISFEVKGHLHFPHLCSETSSKDPASMKK
jgi:hypothetical protein